MDNSNDNDPITVVEFCAGYGGLGLGIKRVLGKRMRLIGLCELEGFAQANLISKMEAGLMAQVPIWSNLLAFPYGKFRGLVDIAVAGIPCQPHSLAGKRKGGGDERFLFDDWLRGLEQMQPRYILIENVEGLLSSKMPDGTLCIAWTIERLEAMGYKATAGIFSAREVGAPHQRKRVFIMAHRDCERGQLSDWWRESAEQVSFSNGEERRAWPSRPGEPQHAWEPPRVVNPKDRRQPRDETPSAEIGRGTTKPCLPVGEGQAVGDTQHDGSHQRDSETRGAQSCGEQGWVQELEGGSSSMGYTEDWSNGQQPTEQQGWHPSRRSGEESGANNELSQAQPSLGRDFDGSSNRMDNAELYITCDNRTDELRLLGNGVVPATAELAFRTLLAELIP